MGVHVKGCRFFSDSAQSRSRAKYATTLHGTIPHSAKVWRQTAESFPNWLTRVFRKATPWEKYLIEIHWKSVTAAWKQMINVHNKKLLQENRTKGEEHTNLKKSWNCWKKNEIPEQPWLVQTPRETYNVGLTQGEFKTRFRNHLLPLGTKTRKTLPNWVNTYGN